MHLIKESLDIEESLENTDNQNSTTIVELETSWRSITNMLFFLEKNTR